MPRKAKQQKHRGVFERQKGSNVWWIRYTDQRGRRVTRKIGHHSAAVHAYDRVTSAIRVGLVVPNASRSGVRLSELIDDAIRFAERHHRAHKDFKQRAELVREAFGLRAAESITTGELQDWIDRTSKERDWTPGTENRFRSTLSTIFREGMRAAKVTGNPARLVRRSREPMGRVRFLSFEEEAELRKAIAATLPGRVKDQGESALAQLDIALHTGMRKSEQFTATWDQVDLDKGYIYLSATKNGSDRYVALNSTARKVLQALKEKHRQLRLPSTSTLFHSKRGGLIANPRKWFATALDQARIKGVTWHTLRHTFASRLLLSGADLVTVKDLLGHAEIKTTLRYAHSNAQARAQAVANLIGHRDNTVTVTTGNLQPKSVSGRNSKKSGRMALRACSSDG